MSLSQNGTERTPCHSAHTLVPRGYRAILLWLAFAVTVSTPTLAAVELSESQRNWQALVAAVPKILEDQDPQTGRFGKGVWIDRDQKVILALAVAWAKPHEANPYYHDEKLLTAIMAGGDALIDEQDETGRWVYRKKDNSTWGKTHQTWTYSRWVRAFWLIREAMPLDRKNEWEDALTLGYKHIAASHLKRVHNIPAHHAMGLYVAGKALSRDDWCGQAKQFMAKVCDAQHVDGYWSENAGPVVNYNLVYVDALGCYYSMSGDKSVLPAIDRAVEFHRNLVYPDGSLISTLDERNPYHDHTVMPGPGFCVTPEGRRFRQQQWLRAGSKQNISADRAALYILHSLDGPLAPTMETTARSFTLSDDRALIYTEAPWTMAISAFCAPVPSSRWIQDRQNFVSLFHEQVGLILGGGNTKLQPRWSNFVIGDPESWPSDRDALDPGFRPPSGFYHTPSKASLDVQDRNLQLEYGKKHCNMQIELLSTNQVTITYSAANVGSTSVTAHCTLIPKLGREWRTANGDKGKLSEDSFHLSRSQIGDWFEHNGWRVLLSPEASIMWPVLPHNPYRKCGHANVDEARIVIVLPISKQNPQQKLTFVIGPNQKAPAEK